MSQYQTNFAFELKGKNRPNKPNPALLSVLDQAAVSTFGPGSRVVVYSGQEDPGEQHGSIRHKTGLAADIRVFRPDGSRVRLQDEDSELFAVNAKRSGIRGFGAGASYMGDAFHVDLFPEEQYTEEMGPIWGNWAAQRRNMLLQARAKGNEAYNTLLDRLGANDQRTDAARRVQYGLGDRGPGNTDQVLQAVAAGDMTKSEASKFVSEDLLDNVTGKSSYDILNPNETEEASLLDRLADAAQYMDFAGIGQAQQLDTPRSLPTSINRGRQNVGSAALQRFGLASLV